MRTILGAGARGAIVRQVQAQLAAKGFSPGAIDGDYGGGTTRAVSGFQGVNGLAVSGIVDDGSWAGLMGTAVPAVADRALQLTANFEGQGFELAVGNFDGALLTWGIVGFTMKAGEVQKIVLEINATNPEIVAAAFGDRTTTLLNMMNDTQANQLAWANSISLPGGSLAQPWRGMFGAFGANPVVQAKQLEHVKKDYTEPSIQLARFYGLKSELGMALCFDVQVQDGGIHQAARQIIKAGRAEATGESDLLKLIANAVGSSSGKFSADVTARKHAIATGTGTVHGKNYVLANWGLDSAFEAAELA